MLLDNMRPGVSGPVLTVLDTDISDLEACCLAAGDAQREKDPARFRGERASVFFRLPYTPPYERFDSLRRLIDKLRQAAGFRWSYVFRGCLWLDVTLWKGHESESYFQAVLKYLADCGEGLDICLCAVDYLERELRTLRLSCHDCGFRSRTVTQRLFDRDTLVRTLTGLEDKSGLTLTSAGAGVLADAVLEVERERRTSALISQVAQELSQSAETGRTLDETEVRRYLAGDTVLSLLTGRKGERKREQDISI